MNATSEGRRLFSRLVRCHGPTFVARRVGGSVGATKKWADGSRSPSGAARSALHAAFGIATTAWDEPARGDRSAADLDLDTLDLDDLARGTAP